MIEFNKLNRDELKKLYIAFSIYRDKDCNGWARMSIQEFYKTNGIP